MQGNDEAYKLERPKERLGRFCCANGNKQILIKEPTKRFLIEYSKQLLAEIKVVNLQLGFSVLIFEAFPCVSSRSDGMIFCDFVSSLCKKFLP